jgi:hypothetical protein
MSAPDTSATDEFTLRHACDNATSPAASSAASPPSSTGRSTSTPGVPPIEKVVETAYRMGYTAQREDLEQFFRAAVTLATFMSEATNEYGTALMEGQGWLQAAVRTIQREAQRREVAERVAAHQRTKA